MYVRKMKVTCLAKISTMRGQELETQLRKNREWKRKDKFYQKEKSAAMEKPAVLLPMEMPREDLGVREVQHMMDGTVACIATGLSHSAIVTNNGTLYTWGKVGSICFFFAIFDFTR